LLYKTSNECGPINKGTLYFKTYAIIVIINALGYPFHGPAGSGLKSPHKIYICAAKHVIELSVGMIACLILVSATHSYGKER